MQYPRFFLLWIGMIFLCMGCVHGFTFFNKLPPPKKPPKISYISTAENIDREPPLLPPPEPALKRFINRNLFEIIGVASLLLLLFVKRRFDNMKRRDKKAIPLDDTDIALIGLAARTLGTLMRRLEAKLKPKIIPLPRGN